MWLPVHYDLKPGTPRATADRLDALTPPTEIPKPDELTETEQEQYILSQSAALSLGFGIGDVSVKGRRVVVVAGMSRYREVTDDQGTRLRYGVALRLVVHVLDVSADLTLSLPVVVAKAQLGQVQTQTSLSIRGYTGPLTLPQFQSLNVDNYSEFTKAVSTLQDLLTKSTEGVQPVLLARLAPDPTPESIDVAAAAVWAFNEIAKGKSLSEAVRRFPDSDEQALLDEIRQVYSRLGISDEDATPDDLQRAQARDQLHGVVLRRDGWFE
jgi:hypothetical protein